MLADSIQMEITNGVPMLWSVSSTVVSVSFLSVANDGSGSLRTRVNGKLLSEYDPLWANWKREKINDINHTRLWYDIMTPKAMLCNQNIIIEMHRRQENVFYNVIVFTYNKSHKNKVDIQIFSSENL